MEGTHLRATMRSELAPSHSGWLTMTGLSCWLGGTRSSTWSGTEPVHTRLVRPRSVKTEVGFLQSTMARCDTFSRAAAENPSMFPTAGMHAAGRRRSCVQVCIFNNEALRPESAEALLPASKE